MLSKEITKKLSGYRQQDKRHSIFSEKHFVTETEVQALIEHNPKCGYCDTEVLFTSYSSRDKQQWTLDRIDNDFGHNRGNVVLSCLRCNLKRGNLCSAEKFRFTKQLTIVCKDRTEPTTFKKTERFDAIVKTGTKP